MLLTVVGWQLTKYRYLRVLVASCRKGAHAARRYPRRDCHESRTYGAWLYSNEYFKAVRCVMCTPRSCCASKVRLLPLRRGRRSNAAKPHEFFQVRIPPSPYQFSRLINVVTIQHFHVHAERHASSSTHQRCPPCRHVQWTEAATIQVIGVASPHGRHPTVRQQRHSPACAINSYQTGSSWRQRLRPRGMRGGW